MQLDDNPLIIPILEFLRRQRQAVSEHTLITHLRPVLDQLPGLAAAEQLALFQTHFLVMNALYQLQRDLLEAGFYLRVSPLEIAIETDCQSGERGLREGSDRALADYYLDLANLRDTDEGDVEQLLSQFWQTFLARDRVGEALAVLELSSGALWPEVQRQYRRLSGRLHPDKGGDSEQFMRVREAYEILRRVLNQRS